MLFIVIKFEQLNQVIKKTNLITKINSLSDTSFTANYTELFIYEKWRSM